jgi:prepilin-type N-terminal cleavage/methylation domain-containing protein
MSRNKKTQRGFSIIELMVAVAILAVGVLACMGMLITGMATNVVNKNDSAGTMLSQMVIEQIYTLPVDSGKTMTITDCAGNTWSIKSNSGGSTTSPWKGAISSTYPLDASGGLNFSMPVGSIPGGYQMNYTTCASQTGESAVYDVRWAVGYLTANTNMVVVSARQSTAAQQKTPVAFRPPVTLRTIQGP